MGIGFMGFGWIYWIIILTIIIIFVIRIFNNNQSKNQNSALDELKKRYAKGEISEDEFNRIKKVL